MALGALKWRYMFAAMNGDMFRHPEEKGITYVLVPKWGANGPCLTVFRLKLNPIYRCKKKKAGHYSGLPLHN